MSAHSELNSSTFLPELDSSVYSPVKVSLDFIFAHHARLLGDDFVEEICNEMKQGNRTRNIVKYIETIRI